MERRLRWKYGKIIFHPRQTKVYTMLGFTLLSLVIFGAFAIRPTLATVTELRRKIKDQEVAREKLDQKVKALSLAQTQLSKNKADLPLAVSALPEGKDLPGLLEPLNSVAEKSEISLSRLSFGGSMEVPQELPNQSLEIKKFSLLLYLEGTFPQFLKFLEAIENTLRQINVKEIRIDSRQGGMERFSLKMEVYYVDKWK